MEWFVGLWDCGIVGLGLGLGLWNERMWVVLW